ncbi:MAG: hypothetical protein VW405_00780 [Rhodospirillaceae bacterium]
MTVPRFDIPQIPVALLPLPAQEFIRTVIRSDPAVQAMVKMGTAVSSMDEAEDHVIALIDAGHAKIWERAKPGGAKEVGLWIDVQGGLR